MNWKLILLRAVSGTAMAMALMPDVGPGSWRSLVFMASLCLLLDNARLTELR